MSRFIRVGGTILERNRLVACRQTKSLFGSPSITVTHIKNQMWTNEMTYVLRDETQSFGTVEARDAAYGKILRIIDNKTIETIV